MEACDRLGLTYIVDTIKGNVLNNKVKRGEERREEGWRGEERSVEPAWPDVRLRIPGMCMFTRSSSHTFAASQPARQRSTD